MAKPKKAPGTPFAPGVSGNPAGRPKSDPEILDAKQMTRATVLQAMHEVMNMPVSDLFLIANPDQKVYATGAKALMASVLSAAILQGCPKRAQFFMSYLFGRPAEYDPKTDETNISNAEKFESVPSQAITEAIRAYNKAKKTAESST